MKIKKLPLLFLFVFSEIFSLTAQQTPVALWDFNDSSTNDQSVNNFNAVVEVINYDKGVNCDTSALFNGKGNRISYGNIMDTLFTKGTFSISLWTNPSSYVDPDGDLSMLIQKWHTSGSSDNSFILYPKAFISSNGSVYFTPLPLNKWSHIAVSVDDGDVYIYIDGELAAMDTTTHHVFASTSYPLMIGSLHNTRYLLDGNIDEVAIYHKALTQSQVKDIMEANSFAHQYTADIEGVIGKDLTIGPDPKTGFSYNWNTGASESKITLKSSEPKTDTYTLEINKSGACSISEEINVNWLYLTDSLVARWNFNDSTLLAETATITEATIDTGIMCSKGFLLKGNSAGINLGDTLNSIFTGADFSFSIWVYPTDTVDENDYTSMILSKWHTSGQIENSFILYLNSLSYDNSDANKHRSMSFGWPELNKWHNYVVVKKESETRVYRDNKLVGKMFGGVISESGYPLMVGTHNNTHYNLNGNVDELKVYNRALSEEFIEQLFTEGYPQALGSLTDQTINKGETITLDAGVGYDSYIWSNGVTTQMNTLGSITETILNFSVYAINNDGCFSDVISITIQTSGLNNLEKNTNVTIWPVPAVETINLSFDNEVPKKIEILNSQGQVVVTRSMVNSEQSINLSDMAAGIYILKLDFVSSIYTKAIIKQ